MMIESKEDLLKTREEAKREMASYDCRILVCSGTGCIATGSQKIYEKFLEILAKDHPGDSVTFESHGEKDTSE